MAFYTEPRWEEAPEGTTGFLPETDSYWACWVKKAGDVIHTANAQDFGGKSEFNYNNKSCHGSWTTRKDMYIERPKKEKTELNWDEAPDYATGYIEGNLYTFWVHVEENHIVICKVGSDNWSATSYHNSEWWREHKHKYTPRPEQSVEPITPVIEEKFFPNYDWTAL